MGERKRDGAGKYGRIFEAQINGFRQCTVNWEAPSAPLVDISSFERKPDTGYTNTETKGQQVDAYADTKPRQTKLMDTLILMLHLLKSLINHIQMTMLKLLHHMMQILMKRIFLRILWKKLPSKRSHIKYAQHQYFNHF